MSKAQEAVKYFITVLDEVTGKTWRDKPDHVQQKMLEVEAEQSNTVTTKAVIRNGRRYYYFYPLDSDFTPFEIPKDVFSADFKDRQEVTITITISLKGGEE